MSYYNTTSESGQTLMDFTTKARKQTDAVLSIVRTLGSASPSAVWKAMGESCPITSVRRALTDLSNDGKLTKDQRKVLGIFGRREHIWRLPTIEDAYRMELLGTPTDHHG